MSNGYDPEVEEARKVEIMNRKEGKLTGYDCPLCLNRGYIMAREDGETRCRECSCMEIRRSLRQADMSGLGKLLKDCRFGNFEAPEPWQLKARDAAVIYASHPVGWFVFSGNSGAGKTHLCTAICRKLLSEGRAVRYVMWRDLAQRMKAASLDSEREKLLKPYREVDVLYIDDFLKTPNNERITSADVGAAIDIIGPRYNAKTTTILSTELSENQIMALDEALGSRIYEMTGKGARFIRAEGADKNWRLRKEAAEDGHGCA